MLPYSTLPSAAYLEGSCLLVAGAPQVWFSHRRRREKKAEHQSPAGDIRQGLATPDRATSPNISHSAGQQPGIVTPTLSDNDAHGSRLAACISDAEQVAGSRQHHSDGQVGQAAAQISQQLPPASNGPLGDNQISSSYTRATPPSSGLPCTPRSVPLQGLSESIGPGLPHCMLLIHAIVALMPLQKLHAHSCDAVESSATVWTVHSSSHLH